MATNFNEGHTDENRINELKDTERETGRKFGDYVRSNISRLTAAVIVAAAGIGLVRRGPNHAHGEAHPVVEAHLDPHELMEHQMSVLQSVYANGMQGHIDAMLTAEERKDLFYDESLLAAVGCVDCGAEQNAPGLRMEHSAGSGILKFGAEAGFDPRDPTYIAERADQLRRAGIVVICSHEDCGAVMEATRIMLGLTPEQVKKMNVDRPGEFNKAAIKLRDDFYPLLANALRLNWAAIDPEKAEAVKIVHQQNLYRPRTHNEVGASVALNRYYKGGGQRDAAGNHIGGSAKLPVNFTITTALLGAEETVKTLDLCLNKIAFGDHGLGNEFTREKPFIITIVLGNNTEDNEHYEEMIQRWHEDLPPEDAARIRIDKVKFQEQLAAA